jgi:ribosomal protein S18 acetylase RimI-like enzyme
MSAAPRAWRAQTPEAEEITRLLVAFREWNGSHTPPAEVMHASVCRLLEDPGTEYLLGASAGEAVPCGVCQLRFRHSVWTSNEDCWIEDLFVAGAARRRGVGRALVQLACERARARAAVRIELDTNETNTTALALYESLGFSAKSKAHGALLGRDVFMGRRL